MRGFPASVWQGASASARAPEHGRSGPVTEKQRRQTPAGKPPAGLPVFGPAAALLVGRRSTRDILVPVRKHLRLAAGPNPRQRTRSSFINSPYAVQLQMERALADCGMETQDKIFDLYVDFLASSVGLSTATGLAQVLDGDVSHDQITRMLARHPSCGADLWRLVKRTVRRLQRDDGVLLLDDTISHKPYTDENELVTWHYDHARNRSVKGIRFISALYHVQGVSVPVSFEVVTKPRWKTDPKSGKPRRRAEQTRGDIYRRLLKACSDNQIPFRYVINDTWYCSAENLNFLHETLKKHFIMPLQSNRLVSVSEADKKAGRFVRLDCRSWEAGQVRRVWPRGLGFPVVVTRQVFENEDGSKGQLYLCSDDLELTAGYGQIYKTRWKCEEYQESAQTECFLERGAGAAPQ